MDQIVSIDLYSLWFSKAQNDLSEYRLGNIMFGMIDRTTTLAKDMINSTMTTVNNI